MKMNFSKDELAMVYQYAAGTKEDTLAGLKEIVPVIRDRQTRDIVENTIRKLDAIPEPECRRFIADTKQRFIQKRDNSIRRRLAEAKAQARAKALRSIWENIRWQNWAEVFRFSFTARMKSRSIRTMILILRRSDPE